MFAREVEIECEIEKDRWIDRRRRYKVGLVCWISARLGWRDWEWARPSRSELEPERREL